MIRLIFALFLSSCAILTVSGSPIERDTTSNGQKGQIWSVTASFVQKTQNPSSKPLGPWKTSKEFDKWISNSSNEAKRVLIKLRESVNDYRESIPSNGGKRKKSTPKELADAIIAVISKSPRQYISLDSVSTLRTQFDNILNRNFSNTKMNSNQVAERLSNKEASRISTLGKVPKAVRESSPSYEGVPDSSSGSILKVVLGGAVGFFLGLVCMAYIKSRQTGGHSEPIPNMLVPEKFSEIKLSLKEAESHNTRLRDEIAALRSQTSVAQLITPESTPQPDVRGDTGTLSGGNAVESTISQVETTGIISPKDSSSASSIFRYAAALNDGYIEDRRISDTGKERFPIKISINATNKDRATFALNPDVNQNWLIETGLERLRSYFDFTLKVGRPESVSAAGNGELIRQGEGWQVTTLAKLTIR